MIDYVNVYINFLNNNVIITVTDILGKVIFWCSPGRLKYKGTKKSTTFAAQVVAIEVKKYLIGIKVKFVFLIIKGLSFGKDSVLRVFNCSNFFVKDIKDKTPIAFNGCRPKKARRT